MVRAKNYQTASTFVKVIQRKLLASFFRTRCIGQTADQHGDGAVNISGSLLRIIAIWHLDGFTVAKY